MPIKHTKYWSCLKGDTFWIYIYIHTVYTWYCKFTLIFNYRELIEAADVEKQVYLIKKVNDQQENLKFWFSQHKVKGCKFCSWIFMNILIMSKIELYKSLQGLALMNYSQFCWIGELNVSVIWHIVYWHDDNSKPSQLTFDF